MILDRNNGGFNGITKDFYTTDLSGNEVVRRYFRALQGGYVINLNKSDTPENVPYGGEATNPYNIIPPQGSIYETGSFVIPFFYNTYKKANPFDAKPFIYANFVQGGGQEGAINSSVGRLTYIGDAGWTCDGVSYKIEFAQSVQDTGIDYTGTSRIVEKNGVYTETKKIAGVDFLEEFEESYPWYSEFGNNGYMPSPDKARYKNINAYKEMFKVPSLFFVNSKDSGINTILKKIGINGYLKDIKKALAKRKVWEKQIGSFFETLIYLREQKMFCVLVKNGNRLEINIITTGWDGTKQHKKTITIKDGKVHLVMFLNTHGVCGCIDIDKRKEKIKKNNFSGGFLDATAPSAYIQNLISRDSNITNPSYSPEPVHILSGAESIQKDSYLFDAHYNQIISCNGYYFYYGTNWAYSYSEIMSYKTEFSVFYNKNIHFWEGES